jgi:hypothetical protein
LAVLSCLEKEVDSSVSAALVSLLEPVLQLERVSALV